MQLQDQVDVESGGTGELLSKEQIDTVLPDLLQLVHCERLVYG